MPEIITCNLCKMPDRVAVYVTKSGSWTDMKFPWWFSRQGRRCAEPGPNTQCVPAAAIIEDGLCQFCRHRAAMKNQLQGVLLK